MFALLFLILSYPWLTGILAVILIGFTCDDNSICIDQIVKNNH